MNGRLNIYIDIDGVLLINEHHLAPGAAEFIKTVADYGSPNWLTTHCREGDATWAVEYVDRCTDEDLTPWLQAFTPTTWTDNKTEAIDFSHPFYWFDDDLYPGEEADLEKHGTMNSLIRIDLQANPEDLITKSERLFTDIEMSPPRVTTCLACDSQDIDKIIYGLVTAEPMLENEEETSYQIGGCVIWPDSPAFQCRDCDNEFGEYVNEN